MLILSAIMEEESGRGRELINFAPPGFPLEFILPGKDGNDNGKNRNVGYY
jgi:hypothetical protein